VNLVTRLNRRAFLSATGGLLAEGALASGLPALGLGRVRTDPTVNGDVFRLRIEPCTIDIGQGVSVKTVAYNGQVPGPVLRMKEGRPITVDVTNATA
jgi:FtsP/CotA-like multicopper oxidase with cupredoxin domain